MASSRLTLLHFNDVHGRLDQLPRLTTLIQRERERARAEGRAVLLLDAGDSSDRNVWESDITKGRANFAVLEAMGVQASVVGNGEALQWGRGALRGIVRSVHFPVLAANLVDLQRPDRPAVEGLRPWALFDAGGIRIGVLGLTAWDDMAYERFGYRALDARPLLRDLVARLRAEGAATVVLLSHIGFATPEGSADFAVRNPGKLVWYNDYRLAQDFPGTVDVIVGGHTHSRLETPAVVEGTIIVQAGDYGRTLGRLDLTVDSTTGRVIEHSGGLLPADPSVPPDPTISATVELVREEAARLFDARVGVAAAELPHAFDSESVLAGVVANALRDICEAELCIFFSGMVHEGLPAGPVTRRALYEAMPAGHVTAAWVTGAQIRRMLEKMLEPGHATESRHPVRDEPPLGLPAASSNVRLAFDRSAPEGERVRECLVDGSPLDPSRTYRLASTYSTLNDLRGNPEYDYLGLSPDQPVEMIRVEQVLWEIVEDWIKARGTVP